MAIPDNTFQNLPPQSPESELAVLGAALLDVDAAGLCVEKLKPEYFYLENHRKIFQAVLFLNERSMPVDLVTVSEALKNRGELDAVGGPAGLAALTESVPSAANVEHYIEIVRKKALLRRLISTSTAIIQECYQKQDEADLVVDTAENRILEVAAQGNTKAVQSISEMMTSTVKNIEDLTRRGVHLTGLPTGFEYLDEITAGLQKGELIIVAARPGMGKTALCLNLARNAATLRKVPVAVFSLEMSAESLLHRLLCAEKSVDSHRLRAGKLRTDEMSRVVQAATALYDTPIFIDDSSALDIQTLRSKARRLVKEKKIGLIVVDYLQMMTSSGRVENRQQEISTISRQLKGLAKELKIPVVVASQLSRATEQRGTKEAGDRPKLSDLRESGAIEQDADMVIFIYRKAYYKNREEGGEPAEDDKVAEIIIAKQRSGPTGTVELIFRKEFLKFENMAPGLRQSIS